VSFRNLLRYSHSKLKQHSALKPTSGNQLLRNGLTSWHFDCAVI
jgi:hypothetical protein